MGKEWSSNDVQIFSRFFTFLNPYFCFDHWWLIEVIGANHVKKTKTNQPPNPNRSNLELTTNLCHSLCQPTTDQADGLWSWKMVIHSDEVKRTQSVWGDLTIRDVRKKMEQVYKEQQPQVYANEVEKQSFVDLMEMWYLDVVVPRLPEAKIRDEFKLSKRTVLNYQQGIKNLGKVAKDCWCRELNEEVGTGIGSGITAEICSENGSIACY